MFRFRSLCIAVALKMRALSVSMATRREVLSASNAALRFRTVGNAVRRNRNALNAILDIRSTRHPVNYVPSLSTDVDFVLEHQDSALNVDSDIL